MKKVSVCQSLFFSFSELNLGEVFFLLYKRVNVFSLIWTLSSLCNTLIKENFFSNDVGKCSTCFGSKAYSAVIESPWKVICVEKPVKKVAYSSIMTAKILSKKKSYRTHSWEKKKIKPEGKERTFQTLVQKGRETDRQTEYIHDMWKD
jgi:hypothetical protein